MNIPAFFIRRPVATILLTIGIALSGILAFTRMPVSPLPQIAFPTIEVMAQMAGASPETMAATVAAPLERHLGTIADVSEMTSQSGVGSTRIILQFGLSRNINGAARDVEAAIQAARADLPTTLHANPTYREFNPAGVPIMILALTSNTLTPAQLYDSADTLLEQKFSQISGVGEVELGGSALPAVRVELEPGKLASYGIGLEDVRAALAAANANAPKGYIDVGPQRYQLYTNDKAIDAGEYKDLVIAYRNGQAVRLSDVAEVINGVENTQNAGLYNGKPAVLVVVHAIPGANIIQTVDSIKATLPSLKAALPPSIQIHTAMDRSVSIRAAVDDTERTLFIAVLLVFVVVFLFLRSPRATFIPGLAVPVSILGTFGPMYLLGFSIDNLSLMALTIATGFVVDDAVVVTENTMRHIESGMSPKEAALRGGAEVGFTVLSMSLSLIAVFLPILLMPGLLGMLFKEFAMTLSITILISLLVSLTTTPVLCALLLKPKKSDVQDSLFLKTLEKLFSRAKDGYEHSLKWALAHSKLVGFGFVLTILLNFFLFAVVPKGFFPNQDTGLLIGFMQADESTSFEAMKAKMTSAEKVIQQDKAVKSVSGYTGGRSTNSAFLFVTLKPYSQRSLSAQQVIAQLRRPLVSIAGAETFLISAQDLHVGGRQSNAEYQYTLTSDNLSDLQAWVPKIISALKNNKDLVDVNSDLQSSGLETEVKINRPEAAIYNITPQEVDATLYDAFGQRTVSTIYNNLNQYEVVMEFAPRYTKTPKDLSRIYVSTSGGIASGTQSTQLSAGSVSSGSVDTLEQVSTISQDSATNKAINQITGSKNSSSGVAVSTTPENMVPLSAFATVVQGSTPITVNHQGGDIATTISFSLPQGVSLGAAAMQIEKTMNDLDVPLTIKGGFAGAAAAFQSTKSSEPLVIFAALAAVYIVLGILYESLIHPLTILSTIPSAGLGATLFLLVLNTSLTIIALIGVILLIGIVKKNAILMIDFALALQRGENMSPDEAIFKAAILRFRPILMTTFAAMLGALPLAIGVGPGAGLRQPLGLTIVGGLVVSQALTLYTTPVLYLWLDRLGTKLRGGQDRTRPRAGSLSEVP